MFIKKTVFILGAGASIPYGLPSGSELVSRIVSLVPDQKDTVVLLGQIYEASGNQRNEHVQFEKFRKTLAESREQSIDAFLQHHPIYEPQAKRAIASLILAAEVKKSLNALPDKFISQDWHPQLLPMMNATFDDLNRNSVGFITFNYDRSLEEFLFGAFKSRESGKRSEDDWAKRLQECIPIVHLHGQVGQHKAFSNDPSKVVKYGDPIRAEQIRTASKEVRIVYEPDIEQQNVNGRITYSPQFCKAWELLNSAQVICFLGFGFHPINVTRLRIEHCNGIKVGTAYGMTKAEKTRIQKTSKGRIVPENLHNHDCSTFLRESIEIHGCWDEAF
jgi:hypothetical protein